MKLFLKMLLLLMPVAAMAQDSVVTISPPVFNENGLFLIAGENGWIFKPGSDTTWARKDIDERGWKKLLPTDITLKYADKNGRFEGWFRLKIKIDKSVNNGSLGIKTATWAATDIYVDGQLITSNGNTGVNGKPYQEGTTFGHLAVPVYLKPGAEHTIAMHLVDEVSPVPPRRLKLEDGGLLDAVCITLPVYNTNYFHSRVKDRVFESMWVSTGAVLSLLFWLLFFQNRREKNLRLIACVTTFATLTLFWGSASENVGLSNLNYWLFTYINVVCSALANIFGLLVLICVFNRRITLFVKIFAGIYFLLNIVSYVLPWDINLFLGPLIAAMIVLNIYYVILSWRRLKGPQWVIVAGLMVSYIFGAVYFYGTALNGNISLDFIQLSVTGFSLSFPLSLLVYVSMRFKEMINEVRDNALQVVKLSEEKKEEALNRQKLLEEEVARQTAEIRANQARLIQAEKMASLGELTAGIAHEIQNPLNFVNNFSEVSVELLTELKEEAEAGHTEDVIAIAGDLTGNLEKIRHHGKRADGIVKGMLEHSRVGTGQKEPTDLNKLAEEYLRLAYHGLRAKDKEFNAELITRFDEKLPMANIIPQDIGRVLLNLFNNAFYAVNQKTKTAGPGYKPTVGVSTGVKDDQMVISVKDNGNGIPENIKDKIMQPFFTTKPTGEGTGLDLSLSYDIVVKGHGGSINVATREREFTEFTVSLPL